ncbi:MAG: outer membrane lipoprotein-sorting protein [Silvanigrellaceae bacterium]
MQLRWIVISATLLNATYLLSGKSAFAKDNVQATGQQNLSPTPDDILRRADAIRCPESSFVMEVDIETIKKDELVKLEVYTKGRDKTRINTLIPVRDRKRSMIMKGDDVWAYVPNLKRPVLVSMSQRLAGETALADVSRMRWWQDYAATLDSEDGRFWNLMLQASRKKLPYRQIKVQIEKSTFKPVQAEYLSPSGRILKRAKFSGYKTIAGASRPTEIFFENIVVPSKSSTLKILKLEEKDVPDALFDEQSLGQQ